MTGSALDRMTAGAWYTCIDPELAALREQAQAAVHQHNTQPPALRGAMGAALAALLAEVGEDVIVEAPFHCSYGMNIALGAAVYMNFGCTILDSAPVRIGAQTMLGPHVQIYCADHHRDPVLRCKGVERALPVTIGSQVWIGGGAILLPGVTVGDRAIIGAGAVVTRDVAADARVVGNPARETRQHKVDISS